MSNISEIWLHTDWVTSPELYLITQPSDLVALSGRVIAPYTDSMDWSSVSVTARNSRGQVLFIASTFPLESLPVEIAGAVNIHRLRYDKEGDTVILPVTYEELVRHVAVIQNILWQQLRGIGA